ncbi:MAG: hypothetical protein ACK5N9_25400, partial [Pirellula sp.]
REQSTGHAIAIAEQFVFMVARLFTGVAIFRTHCSSTGFIRMISPYRYNTGERDCYSLAKANTK